MRRATLAIAFILALFCFVIPARVSSAFMTPAHSANPDALAQLLETRSCVGCDLRHADLHGQDLRGVNLTRANLSGANLANTNMMAVNVQDADLRGADMKDALVLAVNFMGANLKNATFGHVNFDSSRFCHTVTPDGKTSDRDCP